MNGDNPYESTHDDSTSSTARRPISKKIATVALGIGLLILAYGATGFWLINTLPPNGGAQGRLPSLYVMGVGIVVTMAGLALRDLRHGRTNKSNSFKGIPTAYGIAGLVAIIGLLIFVISRM